MSPHRHTREPPPREQRGPPDAPRLAANLGARVPIPAGAQQIARELECVVRRAAGRRPGPSAGVALEGGTESRPERRRQIRLRVRHRAAALAQQRRRLHPHPLAVQSPGRCRPGHERGDELRLACRELTATGCH